MSVTLESSLCPEASVLLEQYGEHIYCVLLANNIPILSTAYTRTLVSPILRKYTQLVEYSKIPSLYNTQLPTSPPSHPVNELVYVLDLTSPLILSTYLKFKERYFPITCLYENMTSLLEAFTVEELLKRLHASVVILHYERRKDLQRRELLTGKIVTAQLTTMEACKYPLTYSSYWHTNKNHPECVSLLSLLQEYPQALNSPLLMQIVATPFVEPITCDVLELVYKHNKLAALKCSSMTFMKSLIVREFHQLLRDELVANTFLPVNHSLLGCSVVDDKYIVSCMSGISGKWIEEVDFSKCVMTGSLVTACLTCVSFKTTVHEICKYYPAASTTTKRKDINKFFRCSNTLFGKSHKGIEPASLGFKSYTLEGTTLTVTFFDFVGLTSETEFNVTSCNPVQIVVDNESNLDEVANQVYSAYSKYYGDTSFAYSTATKTWSITPALGDNVRGVRSVTISVLSKRDILHGCMSLDRVYYDGKTVYGASSCIAEVVKFSFNNKKLRYSTCHWKDGGDLEAAISRYTKLGYYTTRNKNRVYNVVQEYTAPPCNVIVTPVLHRDMIERVTKLTRANYEGRQHTKVELRDFVASSYLAHMTKDGDGVVYMAVVDDF